jgi:hypothetical protein
MWFASRFVRYDACQHISNSIKVIEDVPRAIRGILNAALNFAAGRRDKAGSPMNGFGQDAYGILMCPLYQS